MYGSHVQVARKIWQSPSQPSVLLCTSFGQKFWKSRSLGVMSCLQTWAQIFCLKLAVDSCVSSNCQLCICHRRRQRALWMRWGLCLYGRAQLARLQELTSDMYLGIKWHTHLSASWSLQEDHSGIFNFAFLKILLVRVHAKSLQSCPTLCDPMDCSPPDSSVHGILQARILEWVTVPSSRGSSQPKDQTCVSYIYLHRQAGSSPLASPGKPHLTV